MSLTGGVSKQSLYKFIGTTLLYSTLLLYLYFTTLLSRTIVIFSELKNTMTSYAYFHLHYMYITLFF